MTVEKKMQRYTIALTKRNRQQIEEIMERKGLASINEVVRFSITMMHDKTFPAYQTGVNRPLQELKPKKSLVEKEIEKKQVIEDTKVAKLKAEIDNVCKVCEDDMNGVVILGDDDQPNECSFFQYSRLQRNVQSVPIMDVEAYTDIQYTPTKEFVKQAQSEERAQYDPNETVAESLGLEEVED